MLELVHVAYKSSSSVLYSLEFCSSVLGSPNKILLQ